MDYSILVDALRSYNKTSGYATRMNAAADAIESLQADLAAARADAERYRWLRRNPTYLGWEHDCPPEFIDANVDAALADGRKNGP